MANQTNKPEGIKPVDVDESKYLVRSRLEIAAILVQLSRSGRMITAYFSNGNDFILTAIIAVRPEQDEIIIDCGANADANQRVLQAGNITFVAAHEQIKIQFVINALRKTRFEGRDAFSMPLPSALLRLQRREYFRVPTPLTRPLKCLIGPQEPPAHASAEVTIVDISCGGIAIIVSSDPVEIEAGTCFRGCRITLPDTGEVTTDILVRSTFEVTLKNGLRQKHAGCEFLEITERNRALIQRYINNMERKRKDRSSRR